ncbi:MAG TPA: hypothetical protein VHC50_11345 [Puia sp.]|jgi:hypothetical protein|nr:hypothetical protein [Puia sp.]
MTEKEKRLLTYRPSRMEDINVSTPKEALETFFNCFTLEKSRALLWELYERCVLSYESEGTEPDSASDTLFFYMYTEMLLEAAWIINNRQKEKGLKISNKHQSNPL